MQVFALALIYALLPSGFGNAESGCSTPGPVYVLRHDFHCGSPVVAAGDTDQHPDRHSRPPDDRTEFLMEENSEEDDSCSEDRQFPSPGEPSWFPRFKSARLLRLEEPITSIPALKLLSCLRC